MPLDIKQLRADCDGFKGRFFYDGERADIGYVAKKCDDKVCDCEMSYNADGDQDCSVPIAGAGGIDESVGPPIARILNALPEALDEIDSLQQQVAELTAELDALKRIEKFLRYYECCDSAIDKMTAATLKAVEDTPFEGNVEDLVMNLEQFRKQRDEALSRSQSDAAIVEAARRWRKVRSGMHTNGPQHMTAMRDTERALADAIDSALTTKATTP